MDLTEQRVLAFAPAHNSHGKRDATAAFIPEANRLVKAAGGGAVDLFDNRKPMARRRREVLAALALAKDQDFTSVAFLCHGWEDGIQAGFNRRTVGQLAKAIQDVVQHSFTTVPLLCCSTGDDPTDQWRTGAGGDGSFADRLRDGLCDSGAIYCRVWAHTTKGHTTRNPNVMILDGLGTPEGGVGGQMVARAGTPLFRKLKKALWAKRGDFRFRAPYMTRQAIMAEVT